MTTRRNIGGRYVEVRERNTSKGHKGTILGNWSSKPKTKKVDNILAIIFLWLVILLIILLSMWFIYITS